jgi:hypothetical protein
MSSTGAHGYGKGFMTQSLHGLPNSFDLPSAPEVTNETTEPSNADEQGRAGEGGNFPQADPTGMSILAKSLLPFDEHPFQQSLRSNPRGGERKIPRAPARGQCDMSCWSYRGDGGVPLWQGLAHTPLRWRGVSPQSAVVAAAARRRPVPSGLAPLCSYITRSCRVRKAHAPSINWGTQATGTFRR